MLKGEESRRAYKHSSRYDVICSSGGGVMLKSTQRGDKKLANIYTLLLSYYSTLQCDSVQLSQVGAFQTYTNGNVSLDLFFNLTWTIYIFFSNLSEIM